jgi:hypothetical protein
MSKYRELLLSLRKGFEELEPLDELWLNSLRDRGRMIIRRVFGEDSAYIQRLFDIEFYHPGPYMNIFGEPGPPADRETELRHWRSGQRETIALLEIMLEDLELGESEQVQRSEGLTVPKSDRVFVVHGHDEGMRESVARILGNLGLKPIVLHEQPDRGRTIIEKFYDYSDVGFAVVLLSPDD